MKTKKIKYIILGISVCIWLGNIAVFIPSENNISVTENQDKIPLQPSTGEITIITPENKTYTSAMSGYYPATYGFENDPDGDFPKGWSVLDAGGTATVISNLDGHSKVLEIHDTSSLEMEIINSFNDQITGTIELFIRSSDNTKRTKCFVYDGEDNKAAYLYFDNDGFIKYYDTSAHTINAYNSNQWYHIRFEWDCITGKWNLWIDGIKKCGLGFYGNPTAMDTIYIGTTTSEQDFYSYIDTVGYSWDSSYNIGDNILEGLLVGYTNTTKLEWTGYSLDNQNNITIHGNKTIPILEEGLHSIQIFGNNSLGTMFQSEKRYFNISSLPLNIVTPENITYYDPMDGYYPAVYGFENDVNGMKPEGTRSDDDPGCESKVIDEFEGHKKVVQIIDNNSADDDADCLLFFDLKSYQINSSQHDLEYWIYPDTDSISGNCLFSSDRKRFTNVKFYSPNHDFRYYDNSGWHTIFDDYTEKWYHIRLDVDYENDRYDIYVDGILKKDDVLFINPVDDLSIVRFSTNHETKGEIYLDAIGLSEYPNYNMGDNLLDGLVLGIEDDTNLEWAEYSLDYQEKQPILGNTTLPLPEDGVHTIQVFGRDDTGNLYKSSLRYFNINISPYISWESPVENENKILPVGAPVFNFRYNSRKLVNVTLEINGFDLGKVWNQTSIILPFYNSSIDGPVTAVLYGYEEGNPNPTLSDSINFKLSKIELEIDELLDFDTEFLGNQLYMILHDPNGDNSKSGFIKETGLSIGYGFFMEVGGGIKFGVGDMDKTAGASVNVKFKASTEHEHRLEIVDSSELTSSLDSENKDYIGPGYGDVYWGEAWIFDWYLRSYYRTYFNGTTRYEEPRIDYTIIRDAEVILTDYNAPSNWKILNPIHNDWSNVDWSSGSAISVDGGVSYEFTHEVQSSDRRKTQHELTIDAEAGANLGLYKLKLSFSFEMQTFRETETKTKYTTSFTIHDDESTDHISMEYGIDKRFGTPIFRTIPNVCKTSNPLEHGTFDYVPPVVQFPDIEFDSSHDGLYPCMDDSPIVKVDISDEGGIQTAIILYSINEGNDWNFVNLSEQVANPGTWDGIIPSQDHGTNVLWYIRAWDNVGSPTVRKDPHGDDYIYTVINRNPIISVISPNGGETFEDNVTIQWTSSDLDGDSLSYEISYNDGGFGWHLIADNISDTSYVWDISDILYSDSILIKVIVYDGYGGMAEDTSNYLFTVEGRIPTKGVEFPLFETVSIVSIGVAVFAMLTTGVLFRKFRIAKK